MSLPENLREAIEEAEAAMVSNSNHTFLPKRRLLVYTAMGSPDDPLVVKARSWLGILTAKKVLPLWTETVPDEELALKMVAMAEGVLSGKISLSKAKKRACNDFHNAVGALLLSSNEEIPPVAKLVCIAASEALNMVLGVKPFEHWSKDQIEKGISDERIVPAGGWGDVASSAVVAYSGFHSDNRKPVLIEFDANKRREFWEWWLREAVSAAWELAQEKVL